MKKSSIRILAVEDSPVQGKRLKFFLEESGFDTVLCSNGTDALAELKGTPPHLIISDVVMPQKDGYEFCSEVKADPAMKDIPVILLTSLKDPLDIIKGLQAGADNFITKPYDDHYLLTRIQYLLANRNLRQSGGAEMVMEIIFRGRKYQINSEKKQILDLLLSVYEAAIFQNEELVKTQELLQNANRDLLNANQELEAFSRTASHDLKSPIGQIIGFSEILIEKYKGVLDQEGINLLKIIFQVSNNMSQLVNDLLRLSKSSRSELVYSTVDLSSLAHEIISKFQVSDSSRKVSIKIQDGLFCNGDKGLLTVVLENLLGNAWKYTSRKESADISFGISNNSGVPFYFITDNGVGFDPNEAEKLFSPFERLRTSEGFPGTGVGLATVKRIIERHGGVIWAEAATGEGSTFYWNLP